MCIYIDLFVSLFLVNRVKCLTVHDGLSLHIRVLVLQQRHTGHGSGSLQQHSGRVEDGWRLKVEHLAPSGGCGL